MTMGDLTQSDIEMDRIIISLEVPAIKEVYDFQVNPEIKIGELTQLLCKAVEEASDHSYKSSGSEILCEEDGQRVLKPDQQLKSYGIEIGDRLMLF